MSEVDKIKKEFEKQYKIPKYAVFINGAYFIERPNEEKYMISLTSIFRDFKNGSKSRDKEIKKLRKALEEIRDNIPRGYVGRPYQIAYEALKDVT